MSKVDFSQFNNKQLFEFSDHICYEVDQFDYCVKKLPSMPPGTERNVFLTSFAAHSRNLHQFIYSDKSSWKDEAFAILYFQDKNDWIRARHPESKLLKDMHEWADIRVAHLSGERLIEPNPWWVWFDAHDEMRIALRSFVLAVAPILITPQLRYFEQRWSWIDGLPRRPTPTPPEPQN